MTIIDDSISTNDNTSTDNADNVTSDADHTSAGSEVAKKKKKKKRSRKKKGEGSNRGAGSTNGGNGGNLNHHMKLVESVVKLGYSKEAVEGAVERMWNEGLKYDDRKSIVRYLKGEGGEVKQASRRLLRGCF